MKNNICTHQNCDLKLHKNLDKCVLHCHKNDYHTDRNSGLLSEFYKELKEYILNEIFKDGDLVSEEFGESFTNYEVRQSLNSDYIVNKKYCSEFETIKEDLHNLLFLCTVN